MVFHGFHSPYYDYRSDLSKDMYPGDRGGEG